MSTMKIGAQMYTLRDHCTTPSEIAASCSRVKKMGYDGIQASAFGPIAPAELKKILDGEGLECAATHEDFERLRDEPQAVIDEHILWDCRYVGIGGAFNLDFNDRQQWLDFIDTYNDVAANFKSADLAIGYHNHNHELVRFGDHSAMDLLVDGLDQDIWFEIDTYWIQCGGGDPAAWIDRVKGRIPCVHFKDMRCGSDRQPLMCEIGDGNLNWPRILEACRNAGTEWIQVERDSGELDPFDSLQISLDNLRAMGV